MIARPESKRVAPPSLPKRWHDDRAPSAGAWIGRARSVDQVPNRLLDSYWFRIIEAVTDMVGLVVAWKATIYVRYLLNPVMHAHLSLALIQELAPPLPLVFLFWALVALRVGLYRKHSVFSSAYFLVGALETISLVSMLFTVVTFFSHGLGATVSRSLVLLFGPIAFAASVVSRSATVSVANAVAARIAADRIAIAGSCNEVSRLLGTLAPSVRSCVAGIIVPGAESGIEPTSMELAGVRVLGGINVLPEQINQNHITRILIVGGLSQSETLDCVKTGSRMGLTVSHALPDIFDDVAVYVRNLDGTLHIEMRAAAFTRKQETVKRALDVCIAAVSLIILAPVFILLMMLIKLTSRGPAFYISNRVGRGGRYFRFLKFRSMYGHTHKRQDLAALNEKNGHLFKVKDDPRVTPLGRFLRRYSLDELPQLCNVVIGDMSLVGPRPLPAEDLDPDGMSRDFREWAEARAQVLPGITGLWQIKGRSNLEFDQLLRWDLEYIRNWSLGLDLRILLATPMAVVRTRGAY